jgi:hypothetical protein
MQNGRITLVQNLVSVKHLALDNSVTVEFDAVSFFCEGWSYLYAPPPM